MNFSIFLGSSSVLTAYSPWKFKSTFEAQLKYQFCPQVSWICQVRTNHLFLHAPTMAMRLEWPVILQFTNHIYFCFIDYAKAFDCVDHNKLCKILKEMEIPDHLICLLRNLYAGQEATVRTGNGTTDWFQIGKGVLKSVYFHPAYLTYMQTTSWETLGLKKQKLKSRLQPTSSQRVRHNWSDLAHAHALMGY